MKIIFVFLPPSAEFSPSGAFEAAAKCADPRAKGAIYNRMALKARLCARKTNNPVTAGYYTRYLTYDGDV
jgi:hypothetical protein